MGLDELKIKKRLSPDDLKDRRTCEICMLGGLFHRIDEDDKDQRKQIENILISLMSYTWSLKTFTTIYEAMCLAIRERYVFHGPLLMTKLGEEAMRDMCWVAANTYYSWGLDFVFESMLGHKKSQSAMSAAQDLMEQARQKEYDFSTVIKKLGDIKSTFRKTLFTGNEVSFEVIDQIEKEVAGGECSRVKTGFENLDNLISGFSKNEYVIVAARPSMGKSAFAFNLADNFISRKYKTLIISLEMDRFLIRKRIIAKKGRISNEHLQNVAQISDEEYERIAYLSRTDTSTKYSDYYCISEKIGTVEDLITECEEARALMAGLDVVVIDYLGKIRTDAKRNIQKNQAIEEISHRLNAYAKDNNTMMIVLSQLNRDVESRTVKKPMLSDLRDSGAIEQDADMVLGLYRESYYNKEEIDPSVGDKVEVLVLKNRNGRVGSVELNFRSQFMAFY